MIRRVIFLAALASSCLSSPQPQTEGTGGGTGHDAGEAGEAGGAGDPGGGGSATGGGAAGFAGLPFPPGGFPGGGGPGGGIFPPPPPPDGGLIDCEVCDQLVACCAVIAPGDPLCANAASTCHALFGPARQGVALACASSLRQAQMQFPGQPACR